MLIFVMVAVGLVLLMLTPVMVQSLSYMSTDFIFIAIVICVLILIEFILLDKVIRLRIRHKQIIEHGTKYKGVVVNYDDDTSVIVNGVPYGFVVALIERKGKETEIYLRTNSTTPTDWPIGSFINVYEYEGEFTWDKNIVK